MTLLEHLAELRHRIIVCVITVFVGSIIVYFLYDHVLNFFLHPYCEILRSNHSLQKCTLYVNNPIDQLTVRSRWRSSAGARLPSRCCCGRRGGSSPRG